MQALQISIKSRIIENKGKKKKTKKKKPGVPGKRKTQFKERLQQKIMAEKLGGNSVFFSRVRLHAFRFIVLS